MTGDSGSQFADPVSLSSRGHGDRRPLETSPTSNGRQVEHQLQVPAGIGGSRPVGLVDHEEVGNLEQARLVGLDGITPAGSDHDDRGVGRVGHINLDLSHPDCLNDHRVKASGVEHPDRPGDRKCQASGMAAGGHRADEDTSV